MDTPDPTPPAPSSSDDLPDTATVEVHAKAAGMSEFLFNAVKAFHRWPIGKVLSREDFDAAVKTVTTHKFV